jgi:hypothetical protein
MVWQPQNLASPPKSSLFVIVKYNAFYNIYICLNSSWYIKLEKKGFKILCFFIVGDILT